MPLSLARRARGAAALSLIAALAACGGGGGGGGGTTTPPPVNGSGDQPLADPVAYSAAPGASLASAAESAAISHHQVSVGGQALAYVATTGHLTASDPSSQAAVASIFYVAYTSAGTNRPVTFVLSGGPGDNQGGLHIGSFAPRRVVTNEPSLTEPSAPSLVDNPDTLLDKTDLVFLDEPGTGLSEAIAPNTNLSLRGVDPDIAVYRDFILRWLTVNQRTASPTFVLGHSYGTARAAMLANLLQPLGVNLRGVTLISPILDFSHNCDTYAAVHVTGSCAASLPTFAAIAAFQGKVAAPADLDAFLQSARDYDDATYAPALAASLAAPATPDAGVTAQLAAFTGIPASTWSSDFGMTNVDFRTQLVPGSILGRTDARVVVPTSSPLAADGSDPAETLLDSAFGNAFTQYLGGELGYTNGSAYTSLDISFSTWPPTHGSQQVPDFIPDLAAAIARNPQLPVLAMAANYDLATPFHQTELDLARLAAGAKVTLKHYAAGHDIYLDNAARPLMKADLAAFYDQAAASN